jgi:hypothetical protein
MPKGTKEQQENGSSVQETPKPERDEELPEEIIPPVDEPRHNSKPIPQKLTAGQFLKRSPKRADIDGLIRSLYSSKIMTFEEWDTEIFALLKKKIN